MAIVKLVDGKQKTVSPEQGDIIWKVLNGEIEGNKTQQEFCKKVEKLYLNWRNAPDSYLLANRELLKDMVTADWMCDRQGNLTRPEPHDKTSRRVATVMGIEWQGL